MDKLSELLYYYNSRLLLFFLYFSILKLAQLFPKYLLSFQLVESLMTALSI